MWDVDGRCECSGVGTGCKKVAFDPVCFGRGVDAVIRCRVVSTIFIGLDETCVMFIAMLMF